MNKEELALELIKLAYRHDQKPKDLISKSQELFNWIISVSDECVKKKKQLTSVI